MNFTIALAGWRSFHIASIRQCKSKCLIDTNTERRAAPIEGKAKALRLSLDDASKLGAARGRRGRGFSRDVVQARSQADEHIGAA